MSLTRTTALIIIIMVSSGCTAQETKIGVKTGLPGKSIATISKPVYDDAMNGFSKYIKEKHGCNNFTVLDTKVVNSKEGVYMDGTGRLVKGTSVEKWTLKQCGKIMKHTLIISPDGKGGNYMVFKEVN